MTTKVNDTGLPDYVPSTVTGHYLQRVRVEANGDIIVTVMLYTDYSLADWYYGNYFDDPVVNPWTTRSGINLRRRISDGRIMQEKLIVVMGMEARLGFYEIPAMDPDDIALDDWTV